MKITEDEVLSIIFFVIGLPIIFGFLYCMEQLSPEDKDELIGIMNASNE